MKRNRLFYAGIILLFLCISALFLNRAYRKLTYIELITANDIADTYTALLSPGAELTQEFEMPYSILRGVSVQIDTFARDNNSSWIFSITESASGELVYQTNFDASLIVDSGYHFFELERNILCKKGQLYAFRITARDVDEGSALAFWRSGESSVENAALRYNEEAIDGDLCFKIYGGEVDFWWSGFTLLLLLWAAFLLWRFLWLKNHKLPLSSDAFFMSASVAALAFLLRAGFCVSSHFCDEYDNFLGGMVIANGGVLYRDYVTQHTPVMYYLCSVFARLGAGSVPQFRLSYYLFEAVVWAVLYFRHRGFFENKILFLLACLPPFLLFSTIVPESAQVLSDGFQGLCCVVLLLEFLRYCEDKTLGPSRCCIVSFAVWGSIGAAFISLYALVWVVLAVFFLECLRLTKEKTDAKSLLRRYFCLIACMLLPPVAAIAYFKANGALGIAFEQFYTFNREVYPKYLGGLGSNLLQPFINSAQNFFWLFSDRVNAILNATASQVTLLQLLIAFFSLLTLILLFRKRRYIESVTIFLVLCCSASRGYGFHGLAAWHIMIFLIAVYHRDLLEHFPRLKSPVFVLILVSCISIYTGSLGNHLLSKQTPLSDFESEVVSLTEDGEDIFYDIWTYNTLYFAYKDRYPVNDAVFMLPWYMDWYEDNNIEDLVREQPRLAVYNPLSETWGHRDYNTAFVANLKAAYTQLSEDPASGWRYFVWLKNE